MKRRLRYNWRRHRWDGKLLTPLESVRLAAMDATERAKFIASIVACLRVKEDSNARRTRRFREKRAVIESCP